MSSRASIIGLAILKVNWETGQRDYLDNFVPMVVECLRSESRDVISLPDLQQDVLSRFNLRLPLNPLRTILRKASRQGFVNLRDGVYEIARDAVAGTSFADTEASKYRSVKTPIIAQRMVRMLWGMPSI